MSRIAYVNGSYLPEGEAKVSIFDRGFLFADGVYEVTPIVNGKLVDYDALMERLDRSLNELRMAWPCSKDELRAVHEELVKRFSAVDVEVELGFTAEQVANEVARCLNCDIQTHFTAPLCIECDACVDVCPTNCLTITNNGGPIDELRTLQQKEPAAT